MRQLLYGFTSIFTALLISGVPASSQPNLISAKPGLINYFEGVTSVNGQPLSHVASGKAFLNVNDSVSTGVAKAEILLTPGVFLRIGHNSEVRMTSLSLIDIRVFLLRGEAMLEADELTKDNDIRIEIDGAVSQIQKPGLYRFTAGSQPGAAVISGKMEVLRSGRMVECRKGNEVFIAEGLKKERFDRKKEDDLYAWSNERSEYESAASYQTAQQASAGVYGGRGVPPGWNGWLWNDAFDSWAWIPGGDLAFFSPFGYGFFAPRVVAYAPLCYARTNGQRWRGHWHGRTNWAAVPVNPRHPPAAGVTPRSPWQNHLASAAAAHQFASTGFRTSTGGNIPVGVRMTGLSPMGHFWSGGKTGHAETGSGGHVGGWARGANASSGSGRFGGGGFHSGAGASGGHLGGAPGGGHFGATSGGGHSGGGGGGHSGGGGGHR